jgi:SAM-dependent methyltransferase
MADHPNYGIDSPAIVTGLFALGAIAIGLTLWLRRIGLPHPFWGIGLGIGVYFLLAASGMVWYSKVGKLRLREQLLDLVPWHGDELVLDVGCGRGLLVVGAAHRLTTGKAIGVDIWIRGAVSGNGPEGALQNARLEGVGDRAEVKEGDARQLPFVDETIDVVVSNFVLHDLKTSADREQMLHEIVCILKPGGQVALVDFIFTEPCERLFRAQGLQNARRSRIGSRLAFWTNAVLNLGLVRVCAVTGSRNSTNPEVLPFPG